MSTVAEAAPAAAGLSVAGLGRATARALVLVASLLTLVLARTGLPAVMLAGAVIASLAALFIVESRFGARAGAWVGYVVGFVVFAHLRNLADDVGAPVRVSYPAEADAALGGGTLPTAWLQGHLLEPGLTTAVDVYCAVVYLSYFLVPHVVGLVLWRRAPALFSRYALAVLVTIYAGLAVSALVPTAPPWLAAEFGDGVEAARVLTGVVGWNPEDYAPGAPAANPVAAMPSLHMAVTAVVAFVAWRSRAARVVAVLYALSMAFALVYTGEHYVSDLLAGAAAAAAAWLLAPMALRAAANRVRVYPQAASTAASTP
jgi:membrane-associated phospholipid phosphatase